MPLNSSSLIYNFNPNGTIYYIRSKMSPCSSLFWLLKASAVPSSALAHQLWWMQKANGNSRVIFFPRIRPCFEVRRNHWTDPRIEEKKIYICILSEEWILKEREKKYTHRKIVLCSRHVRIGSKTYECRAFFTPPRFTYMRTRRWMSRQYYSEAGGTAFTVL